MRTCIALMVLGCGSEEAPFVAPGDQPGDCREAAHACAAFFECVACGEAWACIPQSEQSCDAGPPGEPAPDAMVANAGELTVIAGGQPICDSWVQGPTVTTDLDLSITATCNSGGAVIRFVELPAVGATSPCIQLNGRRRCPETRIDESMIGEISGEVSRPEEGRIEGTCRCVIPTSEGVTALTTTAEFDLELP